ncbi:MAG TPA: hypothetical protein VGM39_11985, partial [Kofleriaceae bacterium]
VGDACDPHAGVSDKLVMFDPFLVKRAEWVTPQQADFQTDHVIFTGVDDSVGMVLEGTPSGTYEMGGTVTQIGTTPGRAHQFAIEAHVTNGVGSYYCEVYNDPMLGMINFKLTYTEDDITHAGLAEADVIGTLAAADFRLVFDTQDQLATCVFDYGAMHYALTPAQVPKTLAFGELRIAFNDLNADLRYFVHLTE